MDETHYTHEIKETHTWKKYTFKVTMSLVFVCYVLTILYEWFILSIEHDIWLMQILDYVLRGEL